MGGDVVAEMCGVVLKTDSHVLEVFCNKPVYRKSLSQIFRFGFHNASAIESLIDKEASLATILDQDDLLQECKAQNTRLAEYFGRVGVLHRLFAYVTGEIEIEGKDRFKYVLAPLFPRALSLTLHPQQIPLRRNRSTLQRHLVHFSHMCWQVRRGPCTLLGLCTRQITR